MLIRRDIPRERDEHVMESGRNAHRQGSVDNVVCDQARIGRIAAIEYLQSSTYFRFLIHLQHVQRNALPEFGRKPLQTKRFLIRNNRYQVHFTIDAHHNQSYSFITDRGSKSCIVFNIAAKFSFVLLWAR